TGTSARWFGWNDPWSGIANVYVDGVLQTQIDTYASSDTPQHLNYTTPLLQYGTHTLTVEVTQTRNAASQGYWVWVDAFDYRGSPPPPSYTRAEEISSAVSYNGTWYDNNYAANSGGHAKLAMSAGARATFTFTGSSARWIGWNDQWSGIAKVY